MAYLSTLTNEPRMPALFSFFQSTIEKRAGFPVRASYWQAMGPADPWHVLRISAGEHCTEIWFGRSFDGESLKDLAVTGTIERGVKDLQMQVHGYNDFQRAIGILAEDPAALQHESLFDWFWVCGESLTIVRGAAHPQDCGGHHLGSCDWRGPIVGS